ncbi:hypothetical protein [Alteromonas lipolytica]|nr:hypothetical protein [Alteromonas lipolytica]GGF61835.1 hypothetical protein GCM10011338_12750 [Alteromonas lipolytica]
MRELNTKDVETIYGGHPVLILAASVLGRAGAVAGTAAFIYWLLEE